MYQTNIRNAKRRIGRFDKNRELLVPDAGQEYAVVEKMMGNGRLQVMDSEGDIFIGRIPGKFRHYTAKVIIRTGDLVIVAKRDFEEKMDVVHRYTYEETLQLIHQGDIPITLTKKITGDDGCDNLGTDDLVSFAQETSADQRCKADGMEAGKNYGNGSAAVSDMEPDIDSI